MSETRLIASALELASPDLYSRNAFRMLELPIEATEREVTRRRELMEKAAKNKLAAPPGVSAIFPRRPPPDEFEIRDAAHAIMDAEHRLVHEFFWFWPEQQGASSKDLALGWLIQGKMEKAVELWRERKHSHQTDSIAKHNLAVLCHYAALEAEKKLLDATSKYHQANSSASQTAQSKLKQQFQVTAKQWESSAELFWQTAVECWLVVFQAEEFWSQITARIRLLDDRSLTTGASHRLQTTLPIVLTLIDARLAIRALELRDPIQAQRHISRYRNSAFSRESVEQALGLAVGPIRALLKSLCKAAEADLSSNAANADGIADRLLAEAKTPIECLDALLTADNPVRQAEHDQVALCLLACLIAFANKTEKWKRTVELLDLAEPIAVSSAAKDTIAKSRSTASSNFESGMCWFCGQNEGDEKAAIEIKMYGEVQRERHLGGTRVRWSETKFKVGKCATCVSEDNKAFGEYSAIFILSILAGVIGGLGISYVYSSWTPQAGFFGGGLAGAFCGTIIYIYFKNVVKVARAKRQGRPIKRRRLEDYPRVKELLGKGWARGERPAN